MGYHGKPWEKGFQTSGVPPGNSPPTPSYTPSNPGTPQGCQPGKKGTPQKNSLNFVPRTSRVPLGDANRGKNHCKAKLKGFPMIPSSLPGDTSVSRSGGLKWAHGPLFRHPFRPPWFKVIFPDFGRGLQMRVRRWGWEGQGDKIIHSGAMQHD